MLKICIGNVSLLTSSHRGVVVERIFSNQRAPYRFLRGTLFVMSYYSVYLKLPDYSRLLERAIHCKSKSNILRVINQY